MNGAGDNVCEARPTNQPLENFYGNSNRLVAEDMSHEDESCLVGRKGRKGWKRRSLFLSRFYTCIESPPANFDRKLLYRGGVTFKRVAFER